MKSRLCSSGPSRRLLVINAAILLLANCFILAQSEDVAEPTEYIETSNWLSTKKGSWPSPDTTVDGTVKKPFYAFHTDASSDQAIVFRLKPDFFEKEKIELASAWDLLFRYSTDSSTTIRSEVKGKPHDGTALSSTKPNAAGEMGWTVGSFDGENTAQWKSTRFLNYNNFLIAFKDVNVKFMENATIDKLEHTQALGYNSEPSTQQNNVQKYESGDSEGIMKDSPSDLIYGKTGAVIEFVKGVASVEAKFKTVPSSTVSTITIKVNAAKNGCELAEPTKTISGATIECKVVDGIPPGFPAGTKLLKNVKISLTNNDLVAFALWNLKGLTKDTDYNILDASKPQISSHVFDVDKVDSKDPVSFVNVIESQPENGDSCYQVSKLAGKPAIEVYLNLPHVNRAISLTTVAATETSKSFCLNDFVALRNIKEYQITYLIKGKVETKFQFAVSTTKSVAPLSLKKTDAKLSEIAGGWVFYNPSFDYSIVGEAKDTDVVNFEACDIVGNCVPYVGSQNVDNHKQKFKHQLDPKYKDILKESQYIRIKSSIPLLDTFKFGYQEAKKTTATEFKKQFYAIAKDSVTFVSEGEVNNKKAYQLKYKLNLAKLKDNQVTVELKAPLDAIDLRVHSLKIRTRLNSKDTEHITKLSVQNFVYQNGADKFEFSKEILQSLGNIGISQKLSFSTDDLFVVDPTQSYSSGKGKSLSLVLEFKKNPKEAIAAKTATVAETSSVDIEFELSEYTQNPEEIVSTDKQHPENTVDILNKVWSSPKIANKIQTIEPKRSGLILSSWISAGADRTLDATAFKNEFLVEPTNAAKPFVKDPIIYRVIIGQHGPSVTQVKYTPDDKKIAYNVVDDISNEEDSVRSLPLNGPFRIGYIIHSQEEQAVKVTVKGFSLKSPALSEHEKNCNVGSIVSGNANCKYFKTLCPTSFKSDSDNCQLKYLYRISEKQCDEKLGCSNIFDHTMLTTNMYAEDEAKAKYIPYQVNANDGTKQNYLKVNKKGITSDDFCVTFTYTAMNSSLLVSTGEADKFHYTLPTFSKRLAEEKRKICASYLTNEPKNVKALYLQFDKAPLNNVNDHYVKFSSATPKIEKFTDPAAFQEGIFADNYPDNLPKVPKESLKDKFNKTYFLAENQFIIPDGSQWSLEADKNGKKRIGFTIDLSIIQTAFIRIYGDKHIYVDTLRTRWIKAPKANNQQLRLGLKATGDDLQKWNNLFDLTASVSSPSQIGLDKKSKSDLLGGSKVVIFNSKSPVDYYQVSIDLSLDLSKFTAEALKKASLEKFKQLEFYLESFTVNDPCVDDSNEVKLCTKKESGSCARLYEDNKSKCDCIPGNEGEQCQTTDYCAKDAAIKTCKTKENCESHPEIEDYKCKCADKFVWDTTNKECLESAKLICKTNEIYSTDLKGCTCIEGMEKVNKTSGICEVYKPCDKDHRALKGIHRELCNKNAECVPTGNKVDSYYCKCTGDFVNAKGGKPDSECVPKICASCDQSCVLDSASKAWKCDCNKGYELQDGKCKATAKIEEAAKKCISDKKPAPFLKADGSCGDCISGFYYDASTKACLAKSDLASTLGCPSGVKAEFKDDNMPGCVCEQNQFFNTATRKCDDKCSEKFEQDCASRGATCEFNRDKITPTKIDIKCKCKDGEIPYSTNTTNAESWKCVSICDFLIAQPENYNGRCATPFSSCNKTVELTKIDFKDGGDSKTISGKVFLFNKTTINEDKSEYCECDLGFKSTGTEKVKGLVCEPNNIPTHTIQGMEFDIDPAKVKDQAYLDKTKIAFIKLIVSILNIKLEPHHTICEPNGAVLKCSTSFESEMDDKIITKKLQDACVPVEGGKCIYLTPKKDTHAGRRRREVNDALYSGSASADADYTLVSKPGVTVTSKIKNFCDDNPCAKYSYSKCVPKPVKDSNTLFECLCEDYKFIQWDHDELIGTTKKLRMQVCSVKNMCKVEGYGCKDAACHFQVEKIGTEYKPETFCSCPKTGLTLADNTLSCGQTCDGKCSNSESCAYEDRKKEHSLVCNCKEGFSGLKCDKKASAEATSKAYLISTIVVSVIAVLALIGLGVLYFKRK